MNRKDLIIVAVLINSGLLIALFISAVRSDRGEKMQPSHTEVVQEVAKTPSIAASQGGDQIDQMLNKYSEKLAEKEKPTVSLPVPVLTPTASKTAIENTVTVEKGDVLDKIARSHGVKVDDIMKLNHLTDTQLKVGQVLKMPPKNVLKKPVVKQEVDSGKYYIVKGGDNPWTIAQKNDMQVEELLRLNNMDEVKAKKLRPGDKLKIK